MCKVRFFASRCAALVLSVAVAGALMGLAPAMAPAAFADGAPASGAWGDECTYEVAGDTLVVRAAPSSDEDDNCAKAGSADALAAIVNANPGVVRILFEGEITEKESYDSGLYRNEPSAQARIKLENAKGLFKGLTGIREINLLGLNAVQVHDMDFMFEGCSSLERIIVRDGFRIDEDVQGTDMFKGCEKLASPTLAYDANKTGAEFARVGDESAPGYFTAGFGGMWGTCYWDITGNTLNVHPGTGADTGGHSPWKPFYKVKSVVMKAEGGGMVVFPSDASMLFAMNTENGGRDGEFQKAGLVERFDFSGVDTSHMTDMSRMFNYLINVPALDLTAFDVSNVTKAEQVFYSNSMLRTIDISNWDTSKMGGTFSLRPGATGWFYQQNVTSVKLGPEVTADVVGSLSSYRLKVVTYGRTVRTEQKWKREGTDQLYTPAELAAAWDGPAMQGTWVSVDIEEATSGPSQLDETTPVDESGNEAPLSDNVNVNKTVTTVPPVAPSSPVATVADTGADVDSAPRTSKVKPKGTSLSKVIAAKGGFTAKWKKRTKQITGYQLQYSTDAKFKKGARTLTIAKAKVASKKVGKLKRGKKYSVRIRTYKQVGNKKYYSAWSKPKTVKTK